jgi:hypothetical protein
MRNACKTLGKKMRGRKKGLRGRPRQRKENNFNIKEQDGKIFTTFPSVP